MNDKIIMDANMSAIKSESGLFLDPGVVARKANDDVVEKYNKRFVSAMEAPIPNRRVAYSYILTRAVPPKMKGTTAAGIIINQLDVDARTLKKLQIMTENVSDEQEVLLVGHHITKDILEPGDIAKIDFRKYKTLNDDHTSGVIETSYEIPLYEIDGYEYLLLDARDIIYVTPKEKKNEQE